MDLICTGSYIPFPQSRMTVGQIVEKLILQYDTVQNDTSYVGTYKEAIDNAIDKFVMESKTKKLDKSLFTKGTMKLKPLEDQQKMPKGRIRGNLMGMLGKGRSTARDIIEDTITNGVIDRVYYGIQNHNAVPALEIPLITYGDLFEYWENKN